MAATIAVTALGKLSILTYIPCHSKSRPIGIIHTPTIFKRLSSALIISDCSPEPIDLASSVSFDIYESLPTFSSLARHSPDTTKLPLISESPLFFTISSDSPVRSASFTRTLPDTTTASAHIWLPAPNTTMSSATSSSVLIVLNTPPLTTFAVGAFSIFILSRTFFALIS